MILPLIGFLMSDRIMKSECAERGIFFIIVPLMGAFLLICYCWGRHYASRLDYARTVARMLEESTDEGAGQTDQMQSRDGWSQSPDEY